MRKTTAFALLALLLGLAAAPCVRAQRAKARAGVRLVETGAFHGNEVSARTGETWLGLYVSKGRSALVPSVVKVELANDPIVDEEPWQKTGKDVSVNRKAAPVFLVSGADALKPGPVLTAHAGEATLAKESDVLLRLAGEEYRLKVSTAGVIESGVMSLDDARLVLSKGGVEQVIYDLGGKGEETETVGWKLLWAGDLDGDRRLDLYVQVSWHYNIIQHKLFLSSRAKGLVREVAEFKISGC